MALIDLDSPSGNLIDLDTYQEPPKPEGGGFMASVKQAIGAGIKGAGQAASDFIPGVDSDNAVKRYGQEVIDANPTVVRSFGDIAAKPLTAVTEATGNAVGSMGGIIGARALGMGITAAAPLTGPLAPATALLGQAVAWFGPAAMAALPSYGGIRDKQIINDPNNEADWKSKAIAGLGAATVGAIETKFGPQQWALSALTKEGRAALAEKFAETTLAKGIGFGLLKGGSIEGAEELVQSPVEQLASYDDPTTKESLKDTAFGGAMGAIGGGVFGGVTGGIVGRRGEAKPAAAETPPATPPVDPGAYLSGAPQTDIQQNIDEATGVARPTAGANPFLSETEAAAQQRIKALDEKRAAGTITKILDASDADSAIATFTASLTDTDMGGILGQANPLIAPAREMQAQAAADQADLADLAQTETRDLNTLRAQLDQESRKQADLDALQATGPGDFDVTKAAVDRARTVEAPTAMQLAMQAAAQRRAPPPDAAPPPNDPQGPAGGPQPAPPSTPPTPPDATTGTRLDGAPFKSRNEAELRRKAKGQIDTHDVVEVANGFVVQPKPQEANAQANQTIEGQAKRQDGAAAPSPESGIAGQPAASATVEDVAQGAAPGATVDGARKSDDQNTRDFEESKRVMAAAQESLTRAQEQRKVAIKNSPEAGRAELESQKAMAEIARANVLGYPFTGGDEYQARVKNHEDALASVKRVEDAIAALKPTDQRLIPVSQRTPVEPAAPDPRLVPVSQRPDAEHVGQKNVPLSDGGKPFKTNKAAKDAKKNQPMLRVVRVAGGFALAPKTDAQIAAQEKNAKRLAVPRFGNPGVPLAAHEFIAGRGGLRSSEKSDMGQEGNPRIGNRFLFGSAGIGMDEATEALKEAGYLGENASHDDARNLINRSLKDPRYTPEGTEQMAEREMDDRRKAFEAEQEAIAAAQEAEDNAWDIHVTAFERATADMPQGVDQSSMDMEDALLAAGYTQQEIEDEGSAGTSPEVDQDVSEAPAGDRPQGDRGREGAPREDQAAGGEGEGLTAPTRADVLRQQDAAGNAAASDQRAQIDREAAAQTLTAQTAPEQRKDTTSDIFGGPSPEEAMAAKAREDEAKAKKKAAADAASGQSGMFDQPAGPTPAAASNPDALRAQADLQNALADLADIFGKNTRATMMPEQEQKMLPVLIKVFDAAFRLGYHKFKDAAKFALDQIRKALGNDAADLITLDHLQGAYISMAGGKAGVDTKRAVIDIEDKAEIESHTAKATGPTPATAASPVVAKYPSVEGVEIHVIKNDAGHAVSMFDTDIGEYLPTLRMFKGADSLEKATAYAKDIEKKAEKADTPRKDAPNVPSTNNSVEPNRAEPTTGQPVVAPVSPGPAGTDQGTGQGGGNTQSQGGRRTGNARVPSDRAAVDGERSDQLFRGDDEPTGPEGVDARTDFGERSGDSGITGVPPESVPASEVGAVAVRGDDELRKRGQQLAAGKLPVKLGDPANIRETLPYLLPGQQEDVHKAEQRFAKPDGYGMLFTNGTGTGKTFTGLGVIKRHAMQGKTNTLVIVPDDKIAEDWVASGKALGLDITRLTSTKDKGKGVVITTYANMGENDELANRKWDLIVPDEAHSLMQSADGTVTGYLQNLRAITLHPDGAFHRYAMQNRQDIERAAFIDKEIIANSRIMNNDDTMDAVRASLLRENDRLEAEARPLRKKLAEAREAVTAEVQASQGENRPRLAFLSATPFAYEKTVDWANGYLFDYKDGYPYIETSLAYNQPNPRENFFMTRFGYSMRYNKLNEPDGTKVDRGLMQRQFNGELKRAGSLSGRMLDVPADYDRRFVLVDSAIGNKIDEALAWLTEKTKSPKSDASSGYESLRSAIEGNFDYLSRRYLLEAIKTQEVVPIIRKHMAMGRKVVVFHDYKKGGAVNPFDLSQSPAPSDAELAGKVAAFNAANADFRSSFPELVAGLNGLRSPIEVFNREFPGVMLVNGDEKKADLLRRYKSFQSDDTGPQVMLVQSAKNKGWSGHDTTGKHQRVLINLGQPTAPTLAIQQEGRIYRTGQVSDAIMRYLNTGTNWERWTFATTIASRASTAENLGMGELARALKDSFIASFEESDTYAPGHEGEGKGGKERDKAANNAITEYDRAKTFYWATQKKNSKTKAQEGADYFATPEPVGLKMVQWLDVRPGDDALEPSGGHGAIARWIPDVAKRTVIEPSLALRSRLAMVMNPAEDRIIAGTFEDLAVNNKYHGIAMNPPFGTAGRTAVDHLAKAATHLRDGGRIAALIPTGPAADKKFSKWFYEDDVKPVKPLGKIDYGMGPEDVYVGDTIKTTGSREGELREILPEGNILRLRMDGRFELVSVPTDAVSGVARTGPRTESYSPAADLFLIADIKLPQVTFERAGTAVTTRIVVIEKRANKDAVVPQARNIDLSDITDINELFDRLENLDIARRVIPEKAEATPARAPSEQGAQEAKPAKPAKAGVNVGDKVTIGGKEYTVEIYTTNAGKEKRGVWMDSRAEAQKFSQRAFNAKTKPGKWFVDEYWFPKGDGKSTVFARSSGAGVHPDDAKAVVSAIREALPTAPPIHILESVDQAPAELRADIEKAGARDDVDAAYHNGEIYVFPNNIASIERMQFVLAHHEIRHHGLRSILGPKMNAVMLKIHESNPAIRALADEQVRKGYAKSRILATEEAMADMPVAELVKLNGWDKIVAAVREWLRGAAARLRRAGLAGVADAIDAKEWTDKDVAALIARAEGVSRGGSARYASDGTVFGSTGSQTSTPAFLKWFGKSKVVNPDGSPMLVYRGTYGDFDTFKRRTGDIGLHFGDAETASDRVATAVPHRGNKDGKTLSANVMPVYLSIKNPIRMIDHGFWNAENMKGDLLDMFPQDADRIGPRWSTHKGLKSTKDIREFLQSKGYDGVVYKNTGEVAGSTPFRERIAAAREAMLKVFPKGQGSFDLNDQKVPEYIAWSEAERAYREHRNTAGTDSYIAFNPTQVKSTIGNNGDFSATNPDIRFARSAVTGQTSRQHTPEQLRAMKNVGFQVEVPTLKERAQALWKDAGKKMAQGIVDQFAPVKDLDKDAYALMRLAKGASGAFESFLHGGKLKLTDNVYDFDEANKGGVIESLLIPLQGEHHDFMRWVAANRAERLAGEGKENLFSAQDIIDLKTLATGTVPFDYTVKTGPAAGRVTRDRAMIYADSLRVFNGFNKNILDMAEQSGLIDPESRKLWEHEFYVPFYRVADESDGGIRGANIKGGVVRQAAFKQLKGGKNALNADLLDNTLMNWAHLLDAAAKNRAAKAAIEAAERMGVAAPGNQSTLAQMATSINNKHGVVWFMDGGQKRYSLVDDPFLMTAISSLEYAGMRNPVMNAMSTFKHALTIGVTASPFFKIRNLIRDSVQVIGTSSINPNPLANIGNGWKLTNPKSDEYFRLLAGGGTIHFGTMLEGSEAKRVQALVESGVDDATILGDQNKVKQFYRRYIEPGITAYNELGNRGEAINRASLYDQLRKQGASHADASLQARDLMDFSMQGTFTTIRFLTQVVPFLNARLQGLYKLGRGAKEDPSRFSAVVGAAAVMSIALLAAYGDDDDWKKRTEDDRNNWFWFKFGGIAFRIPRPFEIGAIATLAERSFELAFEKEMTGERFRKQIVNLLGDNLSMNPIPQMVKPILDVYANKNSFTGAPIESMGQQRLKPEYRFNERTSMTARAASTGINSITGLVGADGPSPVQIDHMLRGYFGWLGAFVVGAGDVIARPATDQPKQATPDYWKVITGGMAADLRDAPSRYVSAMYDQAKVVGEAYATHRQLLKEGKVDEAREFADENKDDLVRYRVLNRVKGQEAKLNERKRMIERSNMDADTKRATLRMISDQQNNLAKQLAMQ